ncbi:hypothetical protein C7M84_001212 [Penaeus vannamei]|uniref:Oplophorus-luciferin 2-monooxygenase non-catalytic subunit n=1 Tax=Penaeus vannamei TaxID=6689 RepID=A0A3R7QVS5_PENVA|nr:uncharacterized protein LOC113814047 [Penaeus vannamei]ROT80052.1 hypothetical protein C7M84_001212 [Penaeus vannamei]
MQLRYLLLCSAVVLMGCCHPAAAAAQEPPCYVTGEGVSDVTCSASASLQEIGDFLKQLSSSNGVTEYNKFGLYDNLVVQHLPAGLLADLRFSVVEVMSCSNLTKVDDFLGASSASLRNLSMNGNSLTEIPQLNAPALQNLRIFQSDITVVVRRSALQGMPNIEEIKLERASATPLAFYDLKLLKNLYVYAVDGGSPFPAGSFHFDSPALSVVFLAGGYDFKGEAEPGTYDGFPSGSRLWIQKTPKFYADLYFNLLSRGARIESPGESAR